MREVALDRTTAGLLLGAFSLLWIFLGWWWGRENRSLDDDMLAGRKVGLALGIGTAMATWVTSNTTLVAPQLAFQLGIWGMVGYSLGSIGLFFFAPLARRIRLLMPAGYTSGDFIRLRFGNTAWRIFLLISIVYAAGWLVSLGMAGGKLIESLSRIPYPIGMSVILAICTAYTLLGGLRAVIGTDFIQTLLIIVGIVALGSLVLFRFDFDHLHAKLLSERPELLNLLMPAALMFLFNNLLFGMGEIFHSNVWWSRAFAFDRGVGFRAYTLAGIFWTPIPIAAGFLALGAPLLDINVVNSDMVAPLVAVRLLGTAGASLVFIVVFSALASSLDSVLAATADLVTEDIYRKHFRPEASEATLRRNSRLIIVLLGVITWCVCMFNLADLARVLHFTGALVASAIWPIITGLYWKKASGTGAIAGMVFGSCAGLVAYFAIGFYVASLVGAFVSMIATVSLSLLMPENFDWISLAETKFQKSPATTGSKGGI